MEKEIFTIAIDGPAGSGKSTIAKALAEKFNVLFLSTGAIYRVYGLECYRRKLNPESEVDAKKLLNIKIEIKYIDKIQRMYLNSEDVTDLLNNELIGSYASKISQHRLIRENCVEIQRKLAKKQSMIVDGRDIGSVVLPMAKYKFYLDADLFVRAKRRYNDLKNKDKTLTIEKVEEELKQRDYQDIYRKLSPLILCSDAIKIDSTNMSIDEVVNAFINVINKK